MPANTSPIFTLTPNVGAAKISTTSAVPASDGASTGATTVLMYSVFASGANGSFVQKVRFNPVASAAAVTSVATVLRVYLSTVSTSVGSAAGATTATNTMLIAEISVPAVVAASSTAAATYFEIPLNIAIPTGRCLLVSQHTPQTTNQQWQAQAFGGDY